MKTLWIKKITGTYGIIGLIILLSSCDANQGNERSVEGEQNTVTTDQEGDIDEGNDYATRRSRTEGNINNQIIKIRAERDSLIQKRGTVSAREREGIEERLEVLERRENRFLEQQEQLRQGGRGALDAVERDLDSLLLEGVESQEMDRSVRGEGTSLDGPDVNRTGIRTGTEIENRQMDVEQGVNIDTQEDQQ